MKERIMSSFFSTTLQALQFMPLWVINTSGQLSRKFIAKNFSAAMDFLNSVAGLAERIGHHPDLHLTSYRTIEVSIIWDMDATLQKCLQIIIYTHSLGGITDADLSLARKIDEIPVQYSPKWLKDRELSNS
jgi:4a-hydroxytetrahydrobiopterin dehydratase